MENQNFEEAPVRVKQEPPVEFVLILPRPTIGWPAIKQEDVKSKWWVKSVMLTKFDAKWRGDSKLFGTFFTCRHCRLVANTQWHLTKHLKACSKINPARFECDICGKRFRTRGVMRPHMLKHSNENGIYATAPEETFGCDDCDKLFSSSDYLKLHHRKVHNEDEVKCEVCDKICKNRSALSDHSRRHVKIECSICSLLKNSLALHMQSHSAENIFSCDLCEYSTKVKGHLKDHIERKHLLRKLVEDSKCREDFSNFELLAKLLLRHGCSATSSEKKFKCDKCNKAFITTKRLNRHKKEVHDDKFLECQICKKKVPQHQLKSHMKFHSPGNHFESDLCDYKFEGKKDLERHIKRSSPNMKMIPSTTEQNSENIDNNESKLEYYPSNRGIHRNVRLNGFEYRFSKQSTGKNPSISYECINKRGTKLRGAVGCKARLTLHPNMPLPNGPKTPHNHSKTNSKIFAEIRQEIKEKVQNDCNAKASTIYNQAIKNLPSGVHAPSKSAIAKNVIYHRRKNQKKLLESTNDVQVQHTNV